MMPEPTLCGVDQWQGRIVTGTYQREENGHVPTIREENAEIKRKNPVKLSYFTHFPPHAVFPHSPGIKRQDPRRTSFRLHHHPGKSARWNVDIAYVLFDMICDCEKQATVGLRTGVRSRSEK